MHAATNQALLDHNLVANARAATLWAAQAALTCADSAVAANASGSLGPVFCSVMTDYSSLSDVPIRSCMPGLSHWGCSRSLDRRPGPAKLLCETRRFHRAGSWRSSRGQDRTGWVSQDCASCSMESRSLLTASTAIPALVRRPAQRATHRTSGVVYDPYQAAHLTRRFASERVVWDRGSLSQNPISILRTEPEGR